MNKINEPKRILNETFGWNKCRIDCFAKMLLSLFSVRTVNLSEMSVAFESKANVDTTNVKTRNAVEIYLRLWEIETLFSCLKTRGFCFEMTHLRHLDRIEKLMALLTVGLCWAHKIGEWRAEIKSIRFGKHRDSYRPQNSYFVMV